uniref:Uncharacterized protein n=1 Tax=Amphimedon queenslandica TaxID=400682 RepID=A0A1X7TZH7_AMPQE
VTVVQNEAYERLKSNACSTEGFMELSLLEAKTGSTNNNGPTTARLAESVVTRWIITDMQFSEGCISSLTEVLVGVDIRTETDNRNQYPRIEIWGERLFRYKRISSSVPLKLSPHNFTTNGLYRIRLPTPLYIEDDFRGYRLGIYQPPDDRSVVRFYKVNGTGQIGRIVDITKNDDAVEKDPRDGSNCSYPPIDGSFNTNSLSVTNVIPVNDTRAFPDIQFTCNGIITNWIIGITQNQDTSKHYPNIYLKRSSELIHALTVDASAATSSNGNVYNFTSDIEVQYGDILVINVTTNSNPMYYQQYNGPLNYELDSSNGLIPLEHNDYPLISVIVDTAAIITTTDMYTSFITSPTSGASIDDSPLTTVSTGATVQSNISTVSNTVILASCAVFIVLVATILVIILVSVLVCRRRFKKGIDTSENERYTDPQSVVSSRTNDNNIEEQPQDYENVRPLARWQLTEKNKIEDTPPSSRNRETRETSMTIPQERVNNPAYGIHKIRNENIEKEAPVYDVPQITQK